MQTFYNNYFVALNRQNFVLIQSPSIAEEKFGIYSKIRKIKIKMDKTGSGRK